MLDFIICDDDKYFLNIVERIINSFMLKKNIIYKITKFTDYNKNFIEYISKNDNKKIYVLDIEMPSRSGVVISSFIRKNDYKSPIIFLTGHEELGQMLLHKDTMFLSFINKFDEFEKKLINSILKSLNILDLSPYLSFNEGNMKLVLSYDKILYLSKEKNGRKTLIVTSNNYYYVNDSLKDLYSILDSSFVRTHRACIVNMKNVEKIDYKNKEIIFKCGKKINLISRKYKGE